MAALTPYLQIARFDHWFKHVFMLPGVIVALYAEPGLFSLVTGAKILLALVAAGMIASSNYILNELLDADYDALHPVKKHRPIPSGKINKRLASGQWILFGVIGLLLSALLGYEFLLIAALFWIMGCIYNIPPIRSKDKPYFDVLSESVNNPIRLLLGWYATGITVIPPVSLVLAYWMVGSFFMAVKRFAEYRRINDPELSSRYRHSFGHYNEERLLTSIIFYAVAFGLFFGIFLIRYRMELILSVPLIAGFIAWYIHLGFLEDSPTQYPERLYKQQGFLFYCIFCMVAMLSLLFIPIPILHTIFQPTI
jgi:decaprenyl-phosphate phosphoribosyltransferase